MTSTLQPEQGIRVKLNKTYLFDPNYIDTQVGKSEEWATKTDGMVQKGGVNVDYSSKAYAIGGTGTETNNAKYYKEQAGLSAASASSDAATAYAAATNVNVVAVGTDLQDANSKIKAVANNKTNIDTVAGITSDVSTVASKASEVDTVATNIADVNTAAANIQAIQDAPTQASNAQKWAEGSDADVAALGGTHSAKGWANQEANNYSVTSTGSTTPRTLKDRFADVVNVKDFGAKGDGVTDDTDAIQAAFSNAGSAILFPKGSYLIGDTIIIPENIKKVIANGAVITRTADKAIFYKCGSVDYNNLIYPTAKIKVGDNAVSLSNDDISKFDVGDWVFFRSNNLTPNVTAGSRVAVLRRVSSKSSSRVYFDSSFFREMDLTLDDYALRMCKANLAGRVTFEGGTYTSVDQSGTTALFDFLLCYAPDFCGIEIKNSGGAGIRLAHCIGGCFTNSNISNLKDDRDNGHFGYGIVLCGSCIGFSLNSGTIYRCRHGITTASVFDTSNGYTVSRELPSSYKNLIGGCGEPESCYFGPAYIYGCTNSGLNTHEQGYGITITPNVSGCFDGVHVRNSDVQISGGQIVNCRRYGIRLSTASSNPTPTVTINCIVNGTTILNTSGDASDCEGIRNNATGSNITVLDTKISGFKNGIYESSLCNNVYINGCELDSNATVDNQRGIWLLGEGRIIQNTIIKNCDRGIDTTTYPNGNKFRHVSFVGCTSDVYPENYPLVLNEHTVPRDYFISGRYYSSGNGSKPESTQFSDSSCRVSPIYVPKKITVSAIGVNVTTASSADGVVRLGIYDDNGFGYPKSLVLDAGTVDLTTTGVKEISSLTTELTPGLYWLAACVQGAPSTPPKLASTTASSFTSGAKTLQNCLNGTVGYAQTTAGAFPSSFTNNVESCAVAPKIAIKVD